ncbi:MAG: CooT family nickel-binding protein [Planctomycetes bacterium]|nr:CooT family nickel-binding protein [Planctomycetota bacterium]
MCESNVYMRKGKKEELVFENLANLRFDGDKMIMENLFGEQKTVKAAIKELRLMEHKIIIQ